MSAAERIAVVTGGAGAIGAAIGRALARAGARVVVADADLGAAQTIAAGFDGSGHRALALDVCAERSIVDVFDNVETQLGPVATLVCVAGGAGADSGARPRIATLTLDAWIAAEERNARAAFLCVREFLRRRAAASVGDGRIVAVTGPAAVTPGSAADAASATSEAGVVAIARIAALEAGPLGITVNAIVGGALDTAATRASIAETASFLASLESRHVTGATFAVDGGAHLA